MKNSKLLFTAAICFSFIILTIRDLKAQVVYDSLECVTNPKYLNGQEVLKFAEKMPEFPGGSKELLKFISSNLRYPKDQQEWQGAIFITFVIDTNGQISNECIFKRFFSGSLSSVEKEALRVISLMPKWLPGEQSGKKVPVRYFLPVRF